MIAPLASARTAGLLGLVGAALLLGVWLVIAPGDGLSLAALAMRIAHVMAAGVWGGLIVLVNAVHIPAVQGASDAERPALVKAYVPRFRLVMVAAARATVVSGIVLLALSGYVLAEAVFHSSVHVPPLRAGLAWAGAGVGVVMLAIVEAGIAPRMRLLCDPAATPEARAAARSGAERLARLNLVLLGPVTAAMILAAHAY